MRKSFLFPLSVLLLTGFMASAQLPSRPEVYPKAAIASVAMKVQLVSLNSPLLSSVKSLTHDNKMPLILVDSMETGLQSLIVNEADVQVLHVYKKAEEVKPYGEKGRNGVVVATVKGNPQLVRLSGVLDHFQISAEQRKLKVLVNNRQVNPDYFLADIRQIQKVEVAKQDPTAPVRVSWNPNEEFLHIVTL